MKFDDRYESIFKTELLEGARLDGEYELPVIHKSHGRPGSLISFDKAIACKDYSRWVHFYIPDPLFERLWRAPWRYASMLARFEGIISPDFSIPVTSPYFVQLESIAKSRMIGSWLQRMGIEVIPNIRWGGKDTYKFAFEAVEPGGTVAVGTLGCMKNVELRTLFRDGFAEMIKRIEPELIIAYGAVREDVFAPAYDAGIEILPFMCDTARVRKAG